MNSFENLQVGITTEQTLTVEKPHTVSHTKTAILSTPMMIAFMERTSAHSVHPLLPPGFTSVGYEVNIRHKAPAALGSRITVHSKLIEVDDRRLLFKVRVEQGERVVGEGLHRRTIVALPK